MNRTIKIIPIVEATVIGEQSERTREASQLMKKATQFGKVYYVNEKEIEKMTKIGFYSENPESLIVMLNAATETISIVEATIIGEYVERKIESTELRFKSRGYAKDYYVDENETAKTTKIRFYSENPEKLKLILNN